MTDAVQTPTKRFTTQSALLISVICLAVGIAGGWSVRWVRRPAPLNQPRVAAAPTASVAATTGNNATADNKLSKAAADARTALQLKEEADTQAAPLLEQLKSKSSDADLLTRIGNLYYDAQQYPLAVDYYGRSLKTRPSNAAVRTDMATAYWYMGDADTALAEFSTALSYEPTNPNTLFNRGLVRWKGKADGAGALADWNKLLATNPNYEARDKVSAMITEVKKAQPAAR